jgi:hypothetical protein
VALLLPEKFQQSKENQVQGIAKCGWEYQKSKGDLESRSFMRQIDELPDHKNCALWIKNLAPSATIPEIFEKITIRAVYALYVHDTDEKNGTKMSGPITTPGVRKHLTSSSRN